MLLSWLNIFSVVTAVFVTPLVGAAEPITLSLPSITNYADYISQQLTAHQFSTDPRGRSGAVLADTTCGPGVRPCLEAFLTVANAPQCLIRPEEIDYTLTITNTGNFAAAAIAGQLNFPSTMKFVTAVPGYVNSTGQLSLAGINPGQTVTINIRMRITGDPRDSSNLPIRSITTSLNMNYHAGSDNGNTYFTGTSYVLQSDPSCFPPPTPTPTPTATTKPTPTITPTPTNVPPEVEGFIENGRQCATVGDILTYKLAIRNKSDGLATSVAVVNKYPEGTILQEALRTPNSQSPGERTTTWNEVNLGPGDFREYSIRVLVVKPREELREDIAYVDTLTITYVISTNPPRQGTFVTTHRIEDVCQVPPLTPAPLPPKRPAIVCDPAEPSCRTTYHLLNLGLNYISALNPQQQPAICANQLGVPFSEHSACRPNDPDLGVRFAEAIADIIPGDCRVLSDDIISTPSFQDALNRQSQPAAPYLFPLYDAGQDYVRLVEENSLLGMEHLDIVRDTLRLVHSKNWQKHLAIATTVLDLAPPLPTDSTKRAAILAQWADLAASAKRDFDAALPIWKKRVADQQSALLADYKTTQQRRLPKFTPVANLAVSKAKQSIALSCGITSDGGLSQLLPPIQFQYEQALRNRELAYPATQTEGLAQYGRLLDGWRPKLFAALDVFATGNNQPLKDYVFAARQEERPIFDVLRDIQPAYDSLMKAYKIHTEADRAADEQIRLGQFAVALEKPKGMATNCEKEHVFKDPVEFTWCESVGYGSEFIVPEITTDQRTIPVLRTDKQPPRAITQPKTTITEKLIKGSACSGRPGDPYWAADCSCHCDQIVPVKEGRLGFCQASNKEITRDDIYRTTTEECLQDVPIEHIPDPNQTTDHFF